MFEKTNLFIKILTSLLLLITICVISLSIIEWKSYKLKNKEVGLLEIDIKIKTESYVSSLIAQYNTDLQSCLELTKTNKEYTEARCIQEMNDSNLAKIITNWGYGNFLEKTQK